MTNLKASIFSLLILVASLPSQVAHAMIATNPEVDYLFQGICNDCGHTPVSGTLRIAQYGVNDPWIDFGEFVSFTYNGSTLLDSFTVTRDMVYDWGEGSTTRLTQTLDGAEFMRLALRTPVLNRGQAIRYLQVDQRQFVIGDPAAPYDFGSTTSFSQQISSVPEPTSIALLVSGLFGFRFARKKAAQA